jgi:hypothetical protein
MILSENLSGKIVAVINTDSSAGEIKLRDELSTIEIEAESLIINNDEGYAAAVEFGRKLKQKQADVSTFFEPLKQAAHAAHKVICDREKTVLIPLQNAERTIKKGIVVYQDEQARIRKEKEAEMRRLQEAESARLLEEAAKLEAEGKPEAANDALIEAQVAESMSKTVSVPSYSAPQVSGVSSKKDWTIEVTDESQVPVSFLGFNLRPVDLAAVKRLVKENKGKINVPGIKITETSNIALRR